MFTCIYECIHLSIDFTFTEHSISKAQSSRMAYMWIKFKKKEENCTRKSNSQPAVSPICLQLARPDQGNDNRERKRQMGEERVAEGSGRGKEEKRGRGGRGEKEQSEGRGGQRENK